MLTGDQAAPARAAAEALGIDKVHAGLLPEGKSEILRGLGQGNGKATHRIMTAFVGDGLNDGPALATADAGLALAGGSDLALAAGDILLLSPDLRGVPRAVALARAVLRTIRLNLVWAFGYNVLLIPVAAGVFAPLGLGLNPVLAGGAMGLSSLFVLLNSLRLKRFRPPI
jgi:Cu+-exporting ATPase